MTITSFLEIPIDKRIDVVLAWLEKDIAETLRMERFEFADLHVSFYASRKGNTIEINSRMFEKSTSKLHEGEFVARYEVSRVTDIADDESYNRSILKFTYNVDHLQYEKIAYFYIARLGVAFKTQWADEINKTLQTIRAEIEKKQGGHWGWTDWKVDGKTGFQSRIYGLVPDAPETVQNTHETQSVRIDKENITWGELEERVRAGDKEAIELEEELSKEFQPLLKEAATAIRQLAFTPLELAVYETFVKKDPTARVVIRRMTLGELKTLLPEIVRAQPIADPKPIDQSAAQGGAAKSEKQNRSAQLRTENSLKRLREIRLEAIENNRPIPKKAAAMDDAGITDKTWKKYDPELWATWDDKSYKQENQE